MRIYIYTWKLVYASSENAFSLHHKKEVPVSLDFSVRNKNFGSCLAGIRLK